ncbi:Dehydrogenase/reductase SDR family member 11 like protein [Argiope bruennichi]|uniref:Dehydrogenase/reductase SDR family member 11 like protein n=1 Tax=Argiope bruennichi TaxID=94029 RepID=A0A8T0E6Q5_ARGBR|nr:Dehydrogenase/reductase SDR family member 11 like protein [Argiope bruennichi]
MERWSGRVAFVTGASSGIGAELCRTLVHHGMIVVGIARRVDRIQAIAEEERVKNAPGKLVAIKCDVTQESELLSVFEKIRKTFGRLDVLINNAGLSHNSPLLSGTTAEFKNMLDVNVLALCICTREAVKLMTEKRIDDGQIINISSMSGHRLSSTAQPGIHFYTGTKFMVRALTEGLRRELKALNSHIRIGSVSPGLVETEAIDIFRSKDPVEKAADAISAMKILQVQDIAESVLHILRSPQHVEVHDIMIRCYDQKT